MENTNKLRTIFSLPEEATMVDVIDAILTNNGLAEDDEEFVNKDERGVEPRLIIVRDAAIAMFEKKAPENKIAELLAEHLETSPETAQKIVADINQKLIPYGKRISDEEPKREPIKKATQDVSAQELILEKIKEHAPAPKVIDTPPAQKLPYSKKVEIPNVEENAQHMQKSEALQKAKTVIPQPTEPKPQSDSADAYREPIE